MHTAVLRAERREVRRFRVFGKMHKTELTLQKNEVFYLQIAKNVLKYDLM
jgi:hypothetical protein